MIPYGRWSSVALRWVSHEKLYHLNFFFKNRVSCGWYKFADCGLWSGLCIGSKIKALRAKTNTYIKTPVRGEEPVFVVTGRREDVAAAKREILSASEHFSQIRASRLSAGVGTSSPGAGGAGGLVVAGGTGGGVLGRPCGQDTVGQVTDHCSFR